MRRAQVFADETIVVIGVGVLGALLVRLASHAGARVLAVSRRPWARELAMQLGAERTFPFENRAAIVAEIQDETNGRLADCVCDLGRALNWIRPARVAGRHSGRGVG